MAADQSERFEYYRRPTRRDEFLATMERIVPWAELCEVIEPHYPWLRLVQHCLRASQMRSAVVLVSSLGLLLGCSTNRDSRYYSTYRVASVQAELSTGQAEQVHMALANAQMQQASLKFDKPVQLLNSPPPAMPPADIDARGTGRVVAQFVFSETGEVEAVTILEATKESLREVVQQAVKRWRIAPATSAGKPVKVVARQTFNFKTDE